MKKGQNQKLFKPFLCTIIMEEMIKIPREEYEKMVQELTRLRSLQEIDFDIERQIQDGLTDLKKGKIIRLA